MTSLRILHLEHNLNDAELVAAEIRNAGIACAIQRIETRVALVRALEREGWDLNLERFQLACLRWPRGAPARTQAAFRGKRLSKRLARRASV